MNSETETPAIRFWPGPRKVHALSRTPADSNSDLSEYFFNLPTPFVHHVYDDSDSDGMGRDVAIDDLVWSRSFIDAMDDCDYTEGSAEFSASSNSSGSDSSSDPLSDDCDDEDDEDEEDEEEHVFVLEL